MALLLVVGLPAAALDHIRVRRIAKDCQHSHYLASHLNESDFPLSPGHFGAQAAL